MNFFDDYKWHSSLELGENIKGKKIIRKVTASRQNLSRFIPIDGRIKTAGSKYFIHKATKDLWKMSDDGKCIEAVFPDDVLPEELL